MPVQHDVALLEEIVPCDLVIRRQREPDARTNTAQEDTMMPGVAVLVAREVHQDLRLDNVKRVHRGAWRASLAQTEE